ncbi:26206_t:CDS:2, partial [Gigaspora margarita]
MEEDLYETLSNYKEIYKVINSDSVQALSFTNPVESLFSTNLLLVKRARYNPSNKEDKLLKQLKEFEDSDELPTEVVNELVEALS